jgi:hypothetical protein
VATLKVCETSPSLPSDSLVLCHQSSFEVVVTPRRVCAELAAARLPPQQRRPSHHSKYQARRMTDVGVQPRSLDPLPDESITGFLLRLAHRLDLFPTRLMVITGLHMPTRAAARRGPSPFVLLA